MLIQLDQGVAKMPVTITDQAVLSLDSVVKSARLTDLNRNSLAYIREVLSNMPLNDQDYTEAMIDLVRDLPNMRFTVRKLFSMSIERDGRFTTVALPADLYPWTDQAEAIREQVVYALEQEPAGVAEVINGSS